MGNKGFVVDISRPTFPLLPMEKVEKVDITHIICNFKNPLVGREQLNIKTGATE